MVFRGPESEKVLLMIDGLNKIETDTDGKGMIFTKQLFGSRTGIEPGIGHSVASHRPF